MLTMVVVQLFSCSKSFDTANEYFMIRLMLTGLHELYDLHLYLGICIIYTCIVRCIFRNFDFADNPILDQLNLRKTICGYT